MNKMFRPHYNKCGFSFQLCFVIPIIELLMPTKFHNKFKLKIIYSYLHKISWAHFVAAVYNKQGFCLKWLEKKLTETR